MVILIISIFFIRIEGIDLNGEDPFSLRNIAYLGLKLFLAVAGGSTSGIDKSDTVSCGTCCT